MRPEYNLLELLPHRHPFVFIDRITELDVRKQVVRGCMTYSYNCFLLTGLQEGVRIVPAGILLESMAQLSAILKHLLDHAATDQKKAGPGYLAAINSFDYHSPLMLGQQAEITATITHSFGTLIRSSCAVSVAETSCASAELSFQTGI